MQDAPALAARGGQGTARVLEVSLYQAVLQLTPTYSS
jgi:hypothetical protein